jgi:hypothetical protein
MKMKTLIMVLTTALMAAFIASPGMAATKHKKAKAPAAQSETTKKPAATGEQKDPDPKVNCEIKRDPANCR